MKGILTLLATITTLSGYGQYTNDDIVLIVGYGQSNSVGSAPQYISGENLAPTTRNVTKYEKDNVTGTFGFFKSQQGFQSLNEPAYGRDKISILPMLGDMLASHIQATDGTTPEILLISAGKNGTGITGLVRITVPYVLMMNAIRAAKVYATGKGKTLKCAYVAFLHGETDVDLGTTTYAEFTNGLCNDMNDSIKAVTGQSADISVVANQVGRSWWTVANIAAKTMLICNEQQDAVTLNSKYRLATPGYAHEPEMNEFNVQNFQSSHFSARGLRTIAGKIHAAAVAASFTPFRCTGAVLAGNEITVTMTPLSGAVSLDVTRPCINGLYGFEYKDTGTPGITITGVTILNSTQLKITLSGTPAGGTKTLYYAYSQNYITGDLSYFRQNGAVKDAGGNYLLAFSKVL